ncbi:hypothetical protein, partial [Pseudomonas proteolytica]|uniref:hypothetical protein n=1 Tax=Pseudomonas proteolytica TaxID=219574 RepID=UPI0030D7375B
LAGVRRELPLDPAGLTTVLFGFLARPRDQRETKRRLLSPPGFVIDCEQRPMKLLLHVGDSLVTLVPSANVGLSHPVWLVFPSITSSRQDHERKQTRRCQAQRFAFDELNFDNVARLSEFIAAFCSQSRSHAHSSSRRDFVDCWFDFFS